MGENWSPMDPQDWLLLVICSIKIATIALAGAFFDPDVKMIWTFKKGPRSSVSMARMFLSFVQLDMSKDLSQALTIPPKACGWWAASVSRSPSQECQSTRPQHFFTPMLLKFKMPKPKTWNMWPGNARWCIATNRQSWPRCVGHPKYFCGNNLFVLRPKGAPCTSCSQSNLGNLHPEASDTARMPVSSLGRSNPSGLTPLFTNGGGSFWHSKMERETKLGSFMSYHPKHFNIAPWDPTVAQAELDATALGTHAWGANALTPQLACLMRTALIWAIQRTVVCS